MLFDLNFESRFEILSSFAAYVKILKIWFFWSSIVISKFEMASAVIFFQFESFNVRFWISISKDIKMGGVAKNCQKKRGSQPGLAAHQPWMSSSSPLCTSIAIGALKTADSSVGSDHLPISITIPSKVQSQWKWRGNFNFKKADCKGWDDTPRAHRPLAGRGRISTLRHPNTWLASAIMTAAKRNIPFRRGNCKQGPSGTRNAKKLFRREMPYSKTPQRQTTRVTKMLDSTWPNTRSPPRSSKRKWKSIQAGKPDWKKYTLSRIEVVTNCRLLRHFRRRT